MLEKLKNVLSSLKAENKPVWLMALLKMDEIVDRWTLVVSAPWVTEENRGAEFMNVINKLKAELDANEIASIARIGLMPKDDHLVEELLKRHTGDTIKDEPINGNIIHEGEIVEVNLDAQVATHNAENV
jgi:hypothetical protein